MDVRDIDWNELQRALEADEAYLRSLMDMDADTPETDAPQAQSDAPETGRERAVDIGKLVADLRAAHNTLRYTITKDAEIRTLTAIIIGEHLAWISRIADELEELA